MGWLFATVLLLIFVWLLVVSPTFRGVMLLAGAGVGLAIFLYTSNQNEREAKSLAMIQPQQLTFNNVTLGKDYGSWKVVGTVQNNSQHELSGFDLRVFVQDCPEGSSCMTIGQDDASIFSRVPPGQLRKFDGYVSLSNMPTAKKMVWNYLLLRVKAEVP